MTLPMPDAVSHASATCTYCPKLCRFSCPVAQAEARETVTPWGLMRLLEFTRTEDVALDKEVAQTFYHCTGCLRCQTACKHNNDVPQAMWAARAASVDAGHLPEALADMPEQFEEHGAACPMPTLDAQAVGRVFDQSASIAYLPDCKLTRRDPEMVLKLGALLARAVGAPLRLLSAFDGPGCCGFELKAAGLRDDFDAHMRAQVDYWQGVTHVITDCAPMVAQKRHPSRFLIDPQVAAAWPSFEHVIERLALWAPTSPPTSTISGEGAVLHDSCFVGRHLELYEATRTLSGVLFGQALAELDASRQEATCCGGANLYERINPEGAAQCSRALVEQVEREGGSGVVCTQRGCAAQLGGVLEDVAIDLMEAACLAYEIEV